MSDEVADMTISAKGGGGVFRRIIGWAAVAMWTVLACFLAFWGTIENFHEGWLHPELSANLLWSILYLSPMLVVLTLSLVAIRLPRIGAAVLIVTGFALAWWVATWGVGFTRVAFNIIPPTGPLVLLGIVCWFGQIRPRKWAYIATTTLPMLVVIVCAAEPVWRISGRVDDGDRRIRHVEGNGVELIWAPAGPGWPKHGGKNWEQATRICQRLTEDGTSLAEAPQDIWRLPTVEEAVHSMTRHGRNAGGVWDPETEMATYRIKPDKETPLWDPTSQIIYWWTATEKDTETAYIIVWHGGIFPKPKTRRMGSQGFRAVRSP